MPGDESLQHKLDRVRPPRVQITYDVQVGDAQKKVELPFLLGVLADLSGHPEEPLPSMKERKFVEINRDNFNRIMAGMKPRLAMKVDNQLQKDGSRLGVELKFRSIDDFEPEQVVRQVEPLRKLLEARQRLADLKTKITSNDRLDSLLQDIIKDTDRLKRLGEETGQHDQDDPGSSDTSE
ncbi:type VI secretion system contractile sheath small subunit [Tautonia marina]|uniref:type VI secretion system contractile sheath small subunit n=1 Tax=Tautonia marina TaxID=2653855 RepID=UPI00126117E5|nr:type VI secretion system contractile sheath small subunit [Tautonia marina]